LLRDAARDLADTDSVRAFDRVTVTRPAAWLLHPSLARHGARFRLHVATPKGIAFTTGLHSSDAPSTYEGEAARLGMAPYAVFGALDSWSTDSVGAKITIASQAGALSVTGDALTKWIEDSAHTIGAYYGCFPVQRLLVVIAPVDGSRVVRGHALGEGGAVVVVEVGRDAPWSALADDWVLPHEMTHMAFPSMDAHHHWLEEGLATYVPPIARARGGTITQEKAWTDFARGMPMGLPRRADHGLDHTAAWGRTYWGGAMYFMLADLEIRKRTQNRRSLDDALRGVLAAGGNITVSWSIDQVLDVADRATGTNVLRELYDEMADRPLRVDLADLWNGLGVAYERGGLVFSDDAPFASLRRAITAPQEPHAIAACPAPPASGAMARLRLRRR
jgi:hypothetical protein